MKINHSKSICIVLVVFTICFFTISKNIFGEETDSSELLITEKPELLINGNGWFNCDPEKVTCQEAIKYFATCGGDEGSACSTIETTELIELASSLENDPKLIYDYVHNHIDYLPYFGSKKGAYQTYLDGSGNDFDQASLLIALLRASGYTASFNYGTMNIPGDQLANWLGVDQDAPTIATLLRRIMVPHETVDPTTGNTSLIRVWVSAIIDGGTYSLDPAFKSYINTDKIDLATAIGYDRDTFFSVATIGAITNDNYVQNINESGINKKLSEYSTELANTIKNQYPGSDVNDIVGGRKIIQTYLQNYSFSHSFTTTLIESWTDIPIKYMSSLQVKYEGIDHTFTAPMIASKRITITFDGTLPQLRLDGTLIKTGNSVSGGKKSNIELSMKHPNANNNFDADQTVNAPVTGGDSYAIVFMFNDKTEASLEHSQKVLESYISQGLSNSTEKVLGETLNVVGQIWLYEAFLSGTILAKLDDTIWIPHHTVGVVGQTTNYYIDIKGAKHSVASKKANKTVWLTHLNSGSGIWSGFEHGVFEQLMGIEKPAVSTIKLFQLANAQGTKIFSINKDNWSSIKPQLQNYSSGFLNVFGSWVSAGHTLYLPGDGALVLGNWKGAGIVIKAKLSETLFSINMIITGGINGGFGTVNGLKIDSNAIENIIDETTLSASEDGSIITEKSLEPIDMTTGDYLYDSTDLVLNGSIPLVFSRSYNSERSRSDRSLGYGWTHNYDIYLKNISDGGMGLGKRHPLDAVDLITELFITMDIMKNNSDVKGLVVSALAHKWAVDQLINNEVVVHFGSQVLKFAKRSDGTYVSPPGITLKLVDTGNNTFRLESRFGTKVIFNSNGNATKLTDINGNTLTYNYSGSKLSSVRNSTGQSLSFSYSGDHISSISDSNSRSIAYSYDSNGNLITYADPEKKEWKYGYDSNHWMTSLKNPLGKTTATNAYDLLGKVKTQTVPRQTGGNVTYKFYFTGFRNSEIDPDGKQIIYHIDDKGRTIGIEDALGNKTIKEFDGQNHITKITDKRDNDTDFAYDANHNLVSITDALNKKTNLTYDSQFRLTSITDPSNHNISLGYDSKHQLTSIRDALYNIRAMSYYTNGLLYSATDNRDITTINVYDTNGNLDKSTTGTYPAVDFNYDAIGRMVSLKDRVGATTSFAYDKRSLVTGRTDSLGKTVKSVYNSEGKLSSVTDRNGVTTSYFYTDTSKLSKIKSSGMTDISLSYNKHDKLTSMVDSTGTISYTRDALHRVTSTTDGNGFTTSYTYDAVGNVTKMTYPGNKEIKYTYDALNRLKTVTNWLDQTAIYTYDSAGRLTGLNNFNDTTTAYGYDDADRLTSLENKTSGSSVISTYAYMLDENGNRTKIVQDEPLATRIEDADIDYTYNTNKNRLLNTDDSTFSYDDEGQLTNSNGAIQTFGPLHRLKSIVTGVNASTFEYSANGNRTKAVRSGVETKYIYDIAGNVIAETNSAKTITQYYIYGLSLLEMVTTGDDSYCYHYNAIGSTVAMTDEDEDIVNKYAYMPFGKLIDEEEGVSQPFKFVGRHGVMTEPNGLYYMRARYYDADTGRFISEDPIGFAGGDFNLYAYVQNNPVLLIDPSGLITPGRIPGFGTTEVDFSYAYSHEFLGNMSRSSSIVAIYAGATGYGLPATAIFGSVSIISTALDIALHSDNIYVDAPAVIGNQVVPPPYNMLTNPAFDYIADQVSSGLSNNKSCSN